MKIKIIHVLVLSLLPFLMRGQDYVVESFENVVKDLTAKTSPRIDNNGRKCGLIKVYVKDEITATDGPVIGEVIDRGLEKWVYVSHDAKHIKLLFKEHMPLDIIFEAYNYPSITGQMTYLLKLKEDETDKSDLLSAIPILDETTTLSSSSSPSDIPASHYVEQSADQSMNQIFVQTLDATNPIIQNLINNMVFVEGGTFKMGSKEKGVSSNEKPIHKESIKSFHIGKFEVTQKEWELIMGSNPSVTKGDNLPVENVSWEDCQKFIKILNSLTNLGFRLPTEAEWEYVAKGGKDSDEYKYSGSNELNEVAWQRANSNLVPHEVGKRKSNKLGIFDMSGNIAEWTSDGFNTHYYHPRSNMRFVYRGGSYEDLSEQCFRTTHRNNESKSFRSKGLGLRLTY